MSTISTTPTTLDPHGHDPHGGHGNGHDPHLAHHFDTPEQQMASGKLGMWVFLATEILMFGGLFCAYAVYRHNHPDVFEFAHQYLDKTLGAINTIVLITSSLTMAWGVRLAQLGKQRGLITCLILTILGGYGFMGIKSIEYKTKWQHHLGFASANRYDKRYKGDHKPGAEEHADVTTAAEAGPRAAPATTHTPAPGTGAPAEAASSSAGGHNQVAPTAANPTGSGPGEAGIHGQPPAAASGAAPAKADQSGINPEYIDPNAGTPDAAQIRPVAQGPAGLAPTLVQEHGKAHLDEAEKEEMLEQEYLELGALDKTRTSTFFQIYFLMTGLHGIHVLVGMALIFWILVKAVAPAYRRTTGAGGLASLGLFFLYVGILVRHHPTWIIGVLLLVAAAALFVLASARRAALVSAGAAGEFGPDYFAPVDIVGLYWHLVDLIWIFLFPLLYLIH